MLTHLTHWGRVTHICVGNLTIIGSVDWTPGNKFQWNGNQNSYIFIKENPFQYVVWKMAAIFLGLNLLSYHGILLYYRYVVHICSNKKQMGKYIC